MTPPDDAHILALLRGSRTERDAGMRELFERSRTGLFNLALRMTGRPDLADDAVQETFVDVLRSIDGFRGDARLDTWLYRIAVRASLRVAQRAERGTGVLPEEIPGADDPSDSVEQREAAARILSAIAELPSAQRAVLALSAIEGMAQTDIAAILEVPAGTVYSRLHGARTRLRELLSNGATKDPS